MATKPSYLKAGLAMRRGHPNEVEVRALQRHLRALGYLAPGIDGEFGARTELAVKSVQYDLLNNVGESTAADGAAAVAVVNFNRGRVLNVTGVLDQALARCLDDMMIEENLPKLPSSSDPIAANQRLVESLRNDRALVVPAPFLVAMLRQESDLHHFHVPNGNDEDNYITVGLDRNSKKLNARIAITSRGYGAAQYTLFHHPPRSEEIRDFMMDPAGNVSTAVAEYRSKFDRFIAGPTPGTRADDRIAEIGHVPLRECKFERSDPKFMRDCKACLAALPRTTIRRGDALFDGSAGHYEPTQYYKTQTYRDVPLRRAVPCDWPYASRRYNGAGINSYHYQMRILKSVSTGD